MYQYTRKSIGHQFDSGRPDSFSLQHIQVILFSLCCLPPIMFHPSILTPVVGLQSSNTTYVIRHLSICVKHSTNGTLFNARYAQHSCNCCREYCKQLRLVSFDLCDGRTIVRPGGFFLNHRTIERAAIREDQKVV